MDGGPGLGHDLWSSRYSKAPTVRGLAAEGVGLYWVTRSIDLAQAQPRTGVGMTVRRVERLGACKVVMWVLGTARDMRSMGRWTVRGASRRASGRSRVRPSALLPVPTAIEHCADPGTQARRVCECAPTKSQNEPFRIWEAVSPGKPGSKRKGLRCARKTHEMNSDCRAELNRQQLGSYAARG